MAIIDPDGCFNGDRMAMLSDEARLHWPHIFLLANTLGRFEINPRRILDRAYGGFRIRPTETEILGYIREYGDSYLLFIYEFSGQMWAQWDTPAKLLPDYATAKDKRTPAPDGKELFAWKNEYAERKIARRSNISIAYNVSKKPLETSEKLLEDSEKYCLGKDWKGLDRKGKDCPPPPSFDASALFETLYQRHPKKSYRTVAETELADLIAASPEPKVLAEQINRSHSAWCKSEGWQKDGGDFAPKLSEWLRLRCYRDDDPPDSDQRTSGEVAARWVDPLADRVKAKREGTLNAD